MINSLPSNFANAVTPYAPLGRQAVSEENTELKSSPFKPLEESAQSGRNENRRSPDERAAEVEERERTRIAPRDSERSPAEGDGAAAERREQEEAQDTIRELAARDREVRAHERAHAAVGGQYAGAPRYEYTRGPDGVNYATSGEVSIDTSPVPGNPEATIEKAEQIQRAASAPAEPSPQDRRVAAQATQLEVQARAELAAQEREERRLESEQAERARAERSEGEAPSQDTQSLREQQREEAEQEQRKREERAREFAEISARNIDINRRLIEIGVIESPTGSGQLLSQQV